MGFNHGWDHHLACTQTSRVEIQTLQQIQGSMCEILSDPWTTLWFDKSPDDLLWMFLDPIPWIQSFGVFTIPESPNTQYLRFLIPKTQDGPQISGTWTLWVWRPCHGTPKPGTWGLEPGRDLSRHSLSGPLSEILPRSQARVSKLGLTGAVHAYFYMN